MQINKHNDTISTHCAQTAQTVGGCLYQIPSIHNYSPHHSPHINVYSKLLFKKISSVTILTTTMKWYAKQSSQVNLYCHLNHLRYAVKLNYIPPGSAVQHL